MVGKRDDKRDGTPAEHLIPCGPDEVRMEDGTVRIMTETELLTRKIENATGEVTVLILHINFMQPLINPI